MPKLTSPQAIETMNRMAQITQLAQLEAAIEITGVQGFALGNLLDTQGTNQVKQYRVEALSTKHAVRGWSAHLQAFVDTRIAQITVHQAIPIVVMNYRLRHMPEIHTGITASADQLVLAAPANATEPPAENSQAQWRTLASLIGGDYCVRQQYYMNSWEWFGHWLPVTVLPVIATEEPDVGWVALPAAGEGLGYLRNYRTCKHIAGRVPMPDGCNLNTLLETVVHELSLSGNNVHCQQDILFAAPSRARKLTKPTTRFKYPFALPQARSLTTAAAGEWHRLALQLLPQLLEPNLSQSASLHDAAGLAHDLHVIACTAVYTIPQAVVFGPIEGAASAAHLQAMFEGADVAQALAQASDEYVQWIHHRHEK